MNDILKQRLVGALILLALGVAFWPIVFVQPDAGIDDADPQVVAPLAENPAAPGPVSSEEAQPIASPTLRSSGDTQAAGEQVASISPIENEDQGNETGVAPQPTQSVSAQVMPEVNQAIADVPAQPVLPGKSAPEEWTLQVATVSSAEKAETLRGQLGAMNHRVYITNLRTGGKNLYRVCIGPTRTRTELEKLQAGINARFGVASMVVRYSP